MSALHRSVGPQPGAISRLPTTHCGGRATTAPPLTGADVDAEALLVARNAVGEQPRRNEGCGPRSSRA